MIHRNYLTGEQLYIAYYAVLDGKREYKIARKFKISTPTLKRGLDELRHVLAGGTLRRQKTRDVFKYAVSKIMADHQRKEVQTEIPQNTTSVYDVLEVAIASLNSAVEQVIKYEVDRRTENVQKELVFLKDAARKSNVAVNLKKHFDGQL